MIFANPWLMGIGLVGITIPIAVHMMMRRQNKKLVVSSLRLIEECYRVSKRRRRIKNWPIFLARLIAIALLALLFGKPLVEGGNNTNQKEAIAFILDTSVSMKAEGLAGPFWKEASAVVEQALENTSEASRVCLLKTGWWANGPKWVSPSELRSQKASWKPRGASDSLAPSIEKALILLGQYAEDIPRVIHIVSDLQKCSLEGIENLELPESVIVRVSKVGDADLPNRGIKVEAKGNGVLRHGIYSLTGTESKRELEYFENDKRQNLEDNFNNSFRLAYMAPVENWHTRRIKFKEKDAFPQDDQVYDAFFTQSPVDVLLLEPDIDQKVFQWKTFFVSRSLAPFAADKEIADDSRLTRYLPRTIATARAIEKLDELGTHSIVVMPEIARLDQVLSDKLSRFVEEGGGLLLFGGGQIEKKQWNQFLADVIPARILGTEEISDLRTVEIVSDSHSLWGEMDEEDRQNLKRLPLNQRHKLELISNTKVLASYADQTPLIIERKVGKGRCIFINSSADRSWGDWPAQANLFVPTIHLIADRLVSNNKAELRNASIQMECFVKPTKVDIGEDFSGETVTVNGESYVISDDGTLFSLVIDRPGLYPIISSSGETLKVLAVNTAPIEGDFASISAPNFKQMLETKRVKMSDDFVTNAIDLQTEKSELLVKVILLILLIVLIVEPWFANQK